MSDDKTIDSTVNKENIVYLVKVTNMEIISVTITNNAVERCVCVREREREREREQRGDILID